MFFLDCLIPQQVASESDNVKQKFRANGEYFIAIIEAASCAFIDRKSKSDEPKHIILESNFNKKLKEREIYH